MEAGGERPSAVWRVFQPRGVPQAFSVESDSARALVVFTPGGIDGMFEEVGIPAEDPAAPPDTEPDPDAAAAAAQRYGFEVIGPQLSEEGS